MWIDSHCHLDFPELSAELDEVVVRARRAGIGLMVTIGTKLTEFDRLKPADAVVLAVAHRPYREAGWKLVGSLLKPEGFVADVPGLLDRTRVPAGVTLWRL